MASYLIECQLIEAEGLSERLDTLAGEYLYQATTLAEALLRSQQHLQPQDGLYLTDYQVDPSLQSQRRSWILKRLRRS